MHHNIMKCLKIRSAAVSAVALGILSLLPIAQSSPYIISDDRIRNLDVTPVLGRGYSIMTNTYQSVCLIADETTVPSFNYDYSFHDFVSSSSLEVDMASSFSHSFGYWWLKSQVSSDQRQSSIEKTRKRRYLASSMRIERYYSSVKDDSSTIVPDAETLLNNEDYVGFFKSCGPTFVRSIRRAQEVTTFFIFKSSSMFRSRGFSRRIQTSHWWYHRTERAERQVSNNWNKEDQSLQINIQGYGLGLTREGSETLVAHDIQEYLQVMKFAYKALTTVETESLHIGMVYGIEVLPWVNNIQFQIQANLLDESIEVPVVRSNIPRAYLISDPTATVDFDNSSDAQRALFRCKEPSFEKDKYGYCCEAGSLYDFVELQYSDDDPPNRICRPLRQLEPSFIKDNMAANGEFVARMDRSVRSKLNQLSLLEKCISAAKAIPERYDYYILKSQDNVEFDGVIDLSFTVFELKMALDPFNDHAMLKHMAKELDEFLDRFIQPCYAALFGSTIGLSPDTDNTFFMAYPWHSHDECTKLSCLGNSMRWDRSNPNGGCIPSMIAGKDSPSFDNGESTCKKSIINGELVCRYNSTTLSNHHDKTVNCWKATVPRGRIDFFMAQYCMPNLTGRSLDDIAKDSLRKSYIHSCTDSVEKSINVALNKPTKQSNILHHRWGNGYPRKAVDGNLDGYYHRRSVTHTGYDPGKDGTKDPWWYVDLSNKFDIKMIKVFNRQDYLPSRLANFRLTIFKDNEVQDTYDYPGTPGYESTITFNPTVEGDKVQIQLFGDERVLQLAEVQVFNLYYTE